MPWLDIEYARSIVKQIYLMESVSILNRRDM